jgi:hypothetical protein
MDFDLALAIFALVVSLASLGTSIYVALILNK